MAEPSAAWREAFARRREAFVESLQEAVAGCSEVCCRPCSWDYFFGWRLEEGHTPHPWEGEGALDYGVAYLRHMINQGLDVGFGAIVKNGRALVCLKAWEEEEPEWPDGFDPQIVRYPGPRPE